MGPGSATRLGEGHEPPRTLGTTLDQVMPLGLDAERLLDERDEIFARPERVAKVGLDGPEKAWAELAIRGQPHAVTAVAIVMAHRGDHPHRAGCAGKTEVRRRPVSGRAFNRLDTPYAANAGQPPVAGNEAVRARDVPLVQAITIVLEAFAIGMNYLTDVAYSIADPRIRHVE